MKLFRQTLGLALLFACVASLNAQSDEDEPEDGDLTDGSRGGLDSLISGLSEISNIASSLGSAGSSAAGLLQGADSLMGGLSGGEGEGGDGGGGGGGGDGGLGDIMGALGQAGPLLGSLGSLFGMRSGLDDVEGLDERDAYARSRSGLTDLNFKPKDDDDEDDDDDDQPASSGSNSHASLESRLGSRGNLISDEGEEEDNDYEGGDEARGRPGIEWENVNMRLRRDTHARPIAFLSSKQLLGSPYETKNQAAFPTSSSLKSAATRGTTVTVNERN